MDYPKISVVTPSYNQDCYLEQTIQSVISQNYPNLEYIIIDGGSTDRSIDIIKKNSAHLAYWESAEDNGQYHAIQKGFEKCSGEIFTYLNSDDILTPNSLFTIAQIFSDYKQVSWVSGLPNHIDEIGRNVLVLPLPKWNRYRYLTYNFRYIQQEGTFWRRELWEKAGGFISQDFKLASDLELWSRFFQYTHLYFISGLTGSFRVRSLNQRSLELMEEYNKEAYEILSKQQLSNEELKTLSIMDSLPYKILNRLPLLKKLPYIQKVNSNLYCFPPYFEFERTQQRYILSKEN